MPKIGEFTRKRRQTPQEYDDWKAEPTDEKYSALLKSLKPVISSGLTTYAGGDKNLRTRANILATEAINSFKPEAGASLNTWVYQNLQRLRRFRAQRSSVVHIPENVRLDRMQVKRFQTDYLDKHGYEPDELTVADQLGISKGRVRKALHGSEVSETSAQTEKGDLPGEHRTQDRVWMDYVYHDLDPTNRKVFEWTTGHNGSKILSKQEIARRLKISSPAVSLRVSRIMKKLQEGMG